MANRATGNYRDAQGRLRDSNGRFIAGNKQLGLSLGNLVPNFAKLAGAIGVAAAAYKTYDLARDSVSKAMNFEAELSTIQALTGATSMEMTKMQSLALKMGAATKYNALEAAQGIEELLKAGLTPATVQAGGLEAALNLATAGGLGLADAAEIMSTALNAYKKDGMKAAEASNILAGTANASATGVEELRLSLAAVSAVAAGVGFTFSDTNIALGLFANSGLKGSDAGTSLKTMLQNLQPTTKSQIALFKALGLVTKDGSNAFYDAKGNIKPLQTISGTLRKSLGKLTNQQRSLALEMMFGTDAVRAANILYNEGADGVADFRKEMSKVSALDVAKKKMDNAAGAVEQFNGAIETLQISALLPTMPLIKRFATSAADMVDQYTPQITAAVDRMTQKVSRYLNDHFTNNPEFQRITTLEGKIKFVYEDLMKSFNAWMAAEGSAKLQAMTQKMINTIATALNASGPLVDAAKKIGLAVGNGMLTGLKDFAKENPEMAAVMAFVATPGSLPMKGAAAAATVVIPGASAIGENLTDSNKNFGEKMSTFFGLDDLSFDKYIHSPFSRAPGFASGLDRVPYDNFPARLHSGETVLTRTEASAYREDQRSGGGKPSVVVTGNTFHVRNDSDIDSIAAKLAHLIAQ
ncbi:phage tail tape measure protein [Cohnella sp. NL03-T5]|nr:phage tail tape measure protein [Cohnella silvisoli]